jgi:hypothetical protein
MKTFGDQVPKDRDRQAEESDCNERQNQADSEIPHNTNIPVIAVGLAESGVSDTDPSQQPTRRRLRREGLFRVASACRVSAFDGNDHALSGAVAAGAYRQICIALCDRGSAVGPWVGLFDLGAESEQGRFVRVSSDELDGRW